MNILKKNKIWMLLILLASLFYFSNISHVRADDVTGLKVFFSGILKDEEGLVAQSSDYNMFFSLYNSPTSTEPLWNETFINESQVEVIFGKFQVVLGMTNEINFDLESQNYWLGIKVGSFEDELIWDTEMSPRIPIVTLKNLFTQGSIEVSHEEFIRLLLEEFKNNSLGEDDFSQRAFLEFLQEKLSDSGGRAVIISPETLSVLFDEILNFQTENNNVPEGIWETLISFFKDILDTISASLVRVLDQMTEVLAKLTNIEIKQDEILSILENTDETSELSEDTDLLEGVVIEEKPEMTSRFGVNFIVEDFGEAIIVTGSESVRIESEYLTTNSKIFVTPKSPIEGIWWISERFNGEYFEVSVVSPTNSDLLLDYWIITPKDEMLTVFTLPETEDVENLDEVDLNVNLDDPQEESNLNEEDMNEDSELIITEENLIDNNEEVNQEIIEQQENEEKPVAEEMIEPTFAPIEEIVIENEIKEIPENNDLDVEELELPAIPVEIE